MNSDQPEASSSVSPRRTHHLGTFVFDGNLPREDYLRLIEPDGPVHKLVQRLMEKHGGEENVSHHSHLSNNLALCLSSMSGR